MSIFRIKPWPFNKDEAAELYWICSPFMNENREWMLKVAFRYEDNIKMVEVPWGTLPFLRLGQKYINGTAVSSNKAGIISEVNIEHEEFKVFGAFYMPKELYYFYKIYECGLQKICQFKVGKKTYYVPCTEIVRSFFAKSKTLANYILKPNGLDFLIKSSEIIKDCLYLSFSFEVPEKIATKETAGHIGWIKYNEDAFSSWSSVYGNIFSSQTKYNVVELLPPVMKECKWTFRGITVNDSVLILEILSSTGLRTPFKSIKFDHPKIIRNRVTEDPNKIRKRINENDDIYELTEDNEGLGTRLEQKPHVVELEPTKFIFEDIEHIEKISDQDREVILGTKIISSNRNVPGSGESSINVSTEDWTSQGQIQPLEFSSLEIVKGRTGKGLEEFYEAINFIKNEYPSLEISMTEVFLPEGKSFSYYPDGDRRNCAIVRIDMERDFSNYIIEIGRIDEWPISTLYLLQSKKSTLNNNYESTINILLNSVLDNYGHWDDEILKSLFIDDYRKTKHSKHNEAIELAKKIFYAL